MQNNWPTKKLGEVYRSIFGIKVPFVQQIHENSCGPAALEMVYRYYGLQNITQLDIFKKYKKQNPASPSDFYVLTDDLIADVKQSGFGNSRWERMDLDNKDSVIHTLLEFIKKGVPTIACQQFTKELPLIGHFRVIVRVWHNSVYFYDPHSEYGGKKIQWPVEKFIDFWRPTGNNVTGGVLLIIEK